MGAKDGQQKGGTSGSRSGTMAVAMEFEGEAEVAQPDIMTNKSMVDYAPAEISALEQYQTNLRDFGDRKFVKKRQLEVNCVDLKRKIREAIKEFDERLLELYKKRLAIEKCILAEELKILLCNAFKNAFSYQTQFLGIVQK